VLQNVGFAMKSTTIRQFLEDHRTGYLVGPSQTKLDPAEAGEKATK